LYGHTTSFLLGINNLLAPASTLNRILFWSSTFILSTTKVLLALISLSLEAIDQTTTTATTTIKIQQTKADGSSLSINYSFNNRPLTQTAT